jgi:plasmid maintenance system antidote protein VapI
VTRPVNQIKGMSEQVLNDSINRFNSLSSSPLASVSSDGRSLAVRLGSSVPAINKLIDTYNGITGSVAGQYARVRNLRAELAMKLSIYGLASSYGMTDLAEQIRNSDDKINSSAYHTELITQFDAALSDGDLSIITSMVTTLGGGHRA